MFILLPDVFLDHPMGTPKGKGKGHGKDKHADGRGKGYGKTAANKSEVTVTAAESTKKLS